MRFILSRKGYDSQFGGSPSPVFKTIGQNLDGFMYSIPVPERDSKGNSYIYPELHAPKTPTNFPVNTRYFHLDPDIRPELHQELPNKWKPIFGQSEAAASHLKSQHVQKGDIFLFFGLFQDAIWNPNREQWLFGKSKPFHAIWGYMQIADIIENIDESIQKKYPWHPHCQENYHSDPKRNTLYIGNEGKLIIRDIVLNNQGYGTFKYSDKLRLTLPDNKLKLTLNKPSDSGWTHWKLDCLPWLDTSDKKNPKPHMTYHKQENFQNGFFQAASKGQEFVTDNFNNEPKLYKVVLDWFKDLVTLRTSFPENQLQESKL